MAPKRMLGGLVALGAGLGCCSHAGGAAPGSPAPLGRFTVSLDGAWSLSGSSPRSGGDGAAAGDAAAAAYAATVPGDIHHDLVVAGALPDPNIGDNAKHLRAVAGQTYALSRSFPSPPPRPDVERATTRLRFLGVDYNATISLNGATLGQHVGAFHRFGFDVTTLLRPAGQSNTLVVTLAAAPQIILDTLFNDIHATPDACANFSNPLSGAFLPGKCTRSCKKLRRLGVQEALQSGWWKNRCNPLPPPPAAPQPSYVPTAPPPQSCA